MGAAGSVVRIEAGAELALPDGGSLQLIGQQIDIAGDIIAHSGDVTLQLQAFIPQSRTYSPDFSTVAAPRTTLMLEDGAEIDLSGRWINDAGASRDTLIGSDYINGGSLTIRSGAYTRGKFIPDVATVSLAEGSLVNLDSGGYVTPRGKLASDSDGVPLGRGGDFSILLHPSASTTTGDNAIFDRGTLTLTANAPGYVYIDPATIGLSAAERQGLIDDQIELTGTITAFGFQGGGTFTLRAPQIDIRSSSGVIAGEHGQITVPAEFFAEQGFSAYALTGLLRAGIDAGTTVTLSQCQFMPTGSIATATRVADVASVGVRSGTQRPAVDFTLAGLGWTDYRFIGQSASSSYFSDRTLVVGEGAQILGDPGATITLAAQGQLTLAGRIVAPGGEVTLRQVSGTSVPTNDIDQPPSFRNTSLFLTPTAEIDVDGVLVTDPTETIGRIGDVLAGGVVTLASEQLIGLAGSRILASGTKALLDLPRLATDGLGSALVPTVVGSDGGSIEIITNGSGAFDTTLVARSGSEDSAGGSLTIHGPAPPTSISPARTSTCARPTAPRAPTSARPRSTRSWQRRKPCRCGPAVP